ncbi:hypothetical protein B9Z55_006230 [Caenorhabditis nigoni]|uniref:Uncharacterized protein n=1 Tax=Caenorhabditis nigoni TaxID=1611254 RepID=A0A2G5V4A9_9PELO|nr:hypothetical protein B9Z55_006230 [Caenorhabditis nigoni]
MEYQLARGEIYEIPSEKSHQGVSILLGLTRRWCKEKRGYTKTDHKYRDPTCGSSNYVSMTLGLSPTRKPSLFGEPGYVRIIHQSSPKFIPRYFAHFDISIPCCTTNCCLIHISY